MTASGLLHPPARRPSGDSCADGQLIGMTEWSLPQPDSAASDEVPWPRP